MITSVRKSPKLLLSMFLVVILSSLITSIVAASPSPVTWEKLYGGAQDDEAVAIVQADDGGFVIAGITHSFGAGGSDFWLFKVDADGSVAWNRTYGGSEYDCAQAMVQTSDGGYALAGRSSSFGDSPYGIYYNYCWLVKTYSEGNMEWNKIYKDRFEDSKNFEAETLVQTGDGEYTFVATTGFIIGLVDIWLAHVDSAGNMEWNVTCVYGGPSIASSMIQTSDGGYAVSGYTGSLGGYPGMYSYMHLVKVDFNGTKRWVRNYDGLGDNHDLFVVETDDGGYAVAGTTQSPDEGAHYEVWFAKADASGESIPEFPSWAILPIILLVTLVVTVYRKKLTKHS